MKLDIHNHILPASWPDLKKRYGYGGWVQLVKTDGCKSNEMDMQKDGNFFRRIQSNCRSLSHFGGTKTIQEKAEFER